MVLEKLKNYNLFLLILIMTSCAFKSRHDIEESKKIVMKESLPPLNIEIKKVVLQPGKVKLVEVKMPRVYGHEGKISCNSEDIKFYYNDNKLLFFLRESYFSPLKPYTCEFTYRDKVYPILEIEVVEYKYKEERLYVNKRRVFLSSKDQKRVDEEQKVLNKIYSNGINFPLFTTGFQKPLRSYVTSYYGTRRVFNDQKKTQHLGTDFRARVGTPIPSTNSGKVVFSGDLFYTGLTVIIDHGMGIFSVYGHLSKIKVNDGDFILKGTILGDGGATGRVSGPHLHWGVKLHGQYIDGFSLVEETSDFQKNL